MARKKKPSLNVSDGDKIAEWLKKNKTKVIPANQGGENVVRSFFVRRGKKKAAAKVATATKG